MKALRKIKRAKIERTTTKPQGVNLNAVIKDTLAKLREGKLTKSILTKKTAQKNVFLVKFITGKAFTPLTLRKMKDSLKRQGLDVLEASTQSTLNAKGNGEKSFVIFKVRIRPKAVDVGKRNKRTIKKVLAFLQGDE